ncbi:hypothetical protein WN943_009126 [Citrus x changshan-huyou]
MDDELCHNLFDRLPERGVISFSTLLWILSRGEEAVFMFQGTRWEGFKPHGDSVSSVLSAVRDLEN